MRLVGPATPPPPKKNKNKQKPKNKTERRRKQRIGEVGVGGSCVEGPPENARLRVPGDILRHCPGAHLASGAVLQTLGNEVKHENIVERVRTFMANKVAMAPGSSL